MPHSKTDIETVESVQGKVFTLAFTLLNQLAHQMPADYHSTLQEVVNLTSGLKALVDKHQADADEIGVAYNEAAKERDKALFEKQQLVHELLALMEAGQLDDAYNLLMSKKGR